MHVCGMDFSSLASYWQIKALLMLEPSVTPQNQYFPANSERMSVHCLESGCIGKYTHLGPRGFPRAGILHPSALEIALGLRPRAISRASGCKIPALGKSLGPRECIFQYIPPLGSVRIQYHTIQWNDMKTMRYHKIQSNSLRARALRARAGQLINRKQNVDNFFPAV